MEGRARGKSGGDSVASREVWGKVQDAGRAKQVEADDSRETQALHDTKRDEPSKTKISSVTIEGVYLRNEVEQAANPGPLWDGRDGDAALDRSPQYEQSESVRSVSPFAESSFPLSFQGHDDGDVNGPWKYDTSEGLTDGVSFVAPTPRRVSATIGGTADGLGQHSFNAPTTQWKDPTQGREEAGSFSVHQNLQSENDHSTWLKSAAELALAASGNDADSRGAVEGGLSFQTQGQSPSMSAPVEPSLNAVGVTSTFSPMPNVFAPAHTYRSGSPIPSENPPNTFPVIPVGSFQLEPEAAGQSGWGSRFASVQSPGKFGGTPEPLPGRHSPRMPVHPGLTPETMFGFGGPELQPEVQQMFPLSPPLSSAAPPDVNKGVDPRRVSVTNIAPETDREALRHMLESFGPLMELVIYPSTVYNAVTAVAAYCDHRKAQLAVRYLDGAILGGRELAAQREPVDDVTTPVMHDSFALNSQNYVQSGLSSGNEIMPQMMGYDAAPVAGKNRRNSGSFGYGKMRTSFQDPAEAERRVRMLNLSGGGDPGRGAFKSGPSGSGPVVFAPESPARSTTESTPSISEPSNFGRPTKSKFAVSGASNSNNTQHSQNSVPPKFQLNITKVLSGEETRTTLMIRNIPNKYNQKMMLQTLEMHHRGVFDFFYLPIDFKNKCNVGYAFINFRSPKHIVPFFKEFHGRKWGKFNSEKVCEVAFARLQNKANLIGHFQNSSLMNEDPKCRPIIFGENGEQEEFPIGPHVRTKRGPSARESRPDGSP